MAGIFITLEGVEGVGKTTNLDFIRAYLEAESVPLEVTREPGGTPLAESLRELLLTPGAEPLDDKAELLMVFAARAQHLARRILPALERGDWVLCDRFTDATFAYQGWGRGLDLDFIAELEKRVQGVLRPHRTLLLDLPVAKGLKRAGQRSQPDRFERERLDFFESVREGYLARAAAEPERFRIIDASRPLVEVQSRIAACLDELLNARGR